MRLKGTPAFMSFQALMGDGHAHSLADDLESFIYVVLFAALRWLPVKSLHPLNWWINDFFSAPGPNGVGGGGDRKEVNAVSRKYTRSLHSTTSSRAVDWLKAAMDLHHKNRAPNPLWDDGKELRKMWEGILEENLPSDDRVVNLILGVKTRNGGSLHATYTSATSTQDLYRSREESVQPPAPTPSKRPRTHSADDSADTSADDSADTSADDSADTSADDSADNSILPPAPQPSKRSRIEWRPQTRSTSGGSDRDEDLMTGVDSTAMSFGGTDPLSSE